MTPVEDQTFKSNYWPVLNLPSYLSVELTFLPCSLFFSLYHMSTSLYVVDSQGGKSRSNERGGDARRLAKECKFRIMVSLMVFLAKRHYYLAVKVSFRVSREEI